MPEDNKARLQEILGDKYDVEDMIYRGGMGEIYAGRHRKLGAKVAIKIMIQKLTDDPEMKKRFYREAQLYANLRHPNIIHIYDFGSHDAFDYMVFPFIDGETLFQKLQREKRLEEKHCLHVMVSVAKALAYAGENSVIHRDVKPSNIMMEKNGNVLITDFGISKDLKDIEITLPGTVLGSPKYMSPEQVLGNPADSRGDQYALGLIFYEMLIGAYPFKGSQPNALFYSHVNEPVEIPKDIATAHPLSSAIIKKLTAKNPDDRFPDFNALINALNRIQLEKSQAGGKPGKAALALKTLVMAGCVVLLLCIEYIWLNRDKSSTPVAPPAVITTPAPVTPPPARAPETTPTPAPPAVETPPAPQVESKAEPSAPQPEPPSVAPAPAPLPDIAPTIADIRKALLQFGNPDTEGIFAVSVNKPVFRVGDTITYTIAAHRDCHLALLDFSTSGEIVQLFPNRFHPDSLVRAGSVHQIPSQGSFDVTGPAGSETVLGIACDAAFHLLPPNYAAGPFMTVTGDNAPLVKNMHDGIKRHARQPMVRNTLHFLIKD